MPMETYETRFPPLVPPDEVLPAAKHLLGRCPVAHGEDDGGFWVVNRYEDLLTIMQDWGTFNNGVLVPAVIFPEMPPIDSNPPMHRQFRQILNPYLSPQAVGRHEAGFRREAVRLIEAFVADGRCDIPRQLAQPFAARITLSQLFSIEDEDEIEQARRWVHTMTYDGHRESPEVIAQTSASWMAWMQQVALRRRLEPRRDT